MRPTFTPLSLRAAAALLLAAGAAAAAGPPVVVLPAQGEPAPVVVEQQPCPEEQKKPEAPQVHYRQHHPPGIAKWARPSESCHEDGYYVGGGCLFFGHSPQACRAGTWGWDYIGLIPKKVKLLWCPYCKYQGGQGAYKTDGPPYPPPPKELIPGHE